MLLPQPLRDRSLSQSSTQQHRRNTMKSTNNTQTTEDLNKNAIAPDKQSFIMEELSDEAQSAVSGGKLRVLTDPDEITRALSTVIGG
jgi:hypothetical protein